MIQDNIIGYEIVSSSDKKISSFSPGRGEKIGQPFSVATAGDVDLALRKAHRAYREMRHMPNELISLFLETIAHGMDEMETELMQVISDETAYPKARVKVELVRTTAQLRMFAGIARENGWRQITVDVALPERQPIPRPALLRRMMPIGPVVVFGASNFPLAYSTAGGDFASAVAVGCPVIIKAHDAHLMTNALVAEMVMNAARQCGLPDGFFSSLNGDGFNTGKQLVEHPLTAAVGFTGSLAGGRALFDLGNQRPNPIPVFAEMGSVNPIFVFPFQDDNHMKSWVPKMVSSMTLTVGQFCTNPGVLVIQKDQHTQEFTDLLRRDLSRIQTQVMLTPGISESFVRGVEKVKEIPEVKMLLESGVEPGRTAPVLAQCSAAEFLAHPALHHEVFGPYSILVMCEGYAEMLSVAEAIEGQLTATLVAEDHLTETLRDLITILEEKAGRIILNGVPTGVEVCAAMTHGGSYPASTDNRFTAVGTNALKRWIRPVTYQNFPDAFNHSLGG